jgi:4-amino-4-deoxy-L-arabinose transferase-like glycosyltransferase
MKFLTNKTVLSLFLLAVAAFFRFAQTDYDLSLDEADYSLAARHGFRANYLDSDETRELRHFHGPVVAYMIRTSTLLFGENEEAVRLPSRLVGSFFCVALFLLCIAAIPRRGLFIGFVAAFLMAVMPISTHVSGVANMHITASFLIVLVFFFTYFFLESERPVHLYAMAVLLAILFATMEYAFIAAGLTALLLVVYPTAHIHIRPTKVALSKNLFFAVGIFILVLLLFWWAGLAKLHVVKNFFYYLRYSQHGHPIEFADKLTYHVPQWAYLYWFIKLAPVFLVLAIVSFLYFLFRMIRHYKMRFQVMLLIYTVIFLIAMLRQHIMSARYAIYLLPFSYLVAGFFLNDLWQLKSRMAKPLVSILLLAVLATNLPHITNIIQGDYGFKQAAAYLREYSDNADPILTWYPGILKFYLPDHTAIDSYNTRGATPELVDAIRRQHYRFIILYANQKTRWPNDAGYAVIEKYYVLAKTIYQEKEPVLWLYQRPE